MSRYGDKCNVTSCNNTHDGIKHRDTQHQYCWCCARNINDYNRRFDKEEDLPFSGDDITAGLTVLKEKMGANE